MVSALAVSVAMAQDPPAGDGDQREDAVDRMTDEDGNVVTPDDRAAEAAEDHEGGFGGYCFDDADPAHVLVYMKDTTKISEARAAVNSLYEGDIPITRVTVVQGQYAFDDLLDWYRLLLPAMTTDMISVSSGAVMEGRNRIVIGLTDMSDVPDLRELMEDLNIPEGAVEFEDEKAATMLNGRDSVTAKMASAGGRYRATERTLRPEMHHRVRYPAVRHQGHSRRIPLREREPESRPGRRGRYSPAHQPDLREQQGCRGNNRPRPHEPARMPCVPQVPILRCRVRGIGVQC